MIHVLAMRALYVLLLEGRPMTLSEWARALSERQMLVHGGLNVHVLRHASTQGWVTWTPGEPDGIYAVNCRACVLTALSLTGPASARTIADRAGFTARRVRDVLRDLAVEQVVRKAADRLWSLA